MVDSSKSCVSEANCGMNSGAMMRWKDTCAPWGCDCTRMTCFLPVMIVAQAFKHKSAKMKRAVMKGFRTTWRVGSP